MSGSGVYRGLEWCCNEKRKLKVSHDIYKLYSSQLVPSVCSTHSNVLGAKEGSMSQTVQKISRRQKACDRTKLKVCGRLQEIRNVALPRNVCPIVPTVLDHEIQGMPIFLAGILFPQGFHPIPDRRPALNLVFGVVDGGNVGVPFVIHGKGCQFLSSLSINWIVKARMIRLKIRLKNSN